VTDATTIAAAKADRFQERLQEQIHGVGERDALYPARRRQYFQELGTHNGRRSH
jgi:hypothetical protein